MVVDETLHPIVVVTGSRSFSGNSAARAWLRERLTALAPKLVVTGDAIGPDFWAAEWAAEFGVPCLVYGLDGAAFLIFFENGEKRTVVQRWTEEKVPARGTFESRRWPLKRNDAMVAFAASRLPESPVLVVGLPNPDATTQGTGYTLSAASRKGIPTCIFSRES